MENVAVILVVAFVAYILVLGFYRTMTGKAKKCGCSCSAPEKCDSEDCDIVAVADDKDGEFCPDDKKDS
jgi:hypothetical protein